MLLKAAQCCLRLPSGKSNCVCNCLLISTLVTPSCGGGVCHPRPNVWHFYGLKWWVEIATNRMAHGFGASGHSGCLWGGIQQELPLLLLLPVKLSVPSEASIAMKPARHRNAFRSCALWEAADASGGPLAVKSRGSTTQQGPVITSLPADGKSLVRLATHSHGSPCVSTSVAWEDLGKSPVHSPKFGVSFQPLSCRRPGMPGLSHSLTSNVHDSHLVKSCLLYA